jgi:hypothetical protein
VVVLNYYCHFKKQLCGVIWKEFYSSENQPIHALATKDVLLKLSLPIGTIVKQSNSKGVIEWHN